MKLISVFRWISVVLSFMVLQGGGDSVLAQQICASRYQELFDLFQRKDPRVLKMKAGIEIEGSISSKIGHEGVAEIIRRYLSRAYPKATVSEIEPTLSSSTQYWVTYQKANGDKKVWVVKEDHTIRTFDLPLEIASPILEDAEDFEFFNKVVKGIQKAGAQVEPQSGGVHVHVDFENAEVGEIASIAAIFSDIEKEVKKRFSTHPSRSVHIENTSADLLEKLQEMPLDLEDPQLLNRLIYAQDRYHALNLQSYPTHGTIEFRLFNSTFNVQALELMSDFAIKMVKGVRTKNPKLLAYLSENEGRIDLDGIAKALGMKITQPNAKKVLEKILIENQRKLRSSLSNQSFNQPRTLRSYINGIVVILGCASLIQLMNEQVQPLFI